jgi:hypothetical protein
MRDQLAPDDVILARMRILIAFLGLACLSSVLVAADISGTWAAAVTLDAGSGTATFVFKQAGENLTGTYTGQVGSANVTGTVKGSDVEWSFEGGQAGKISYKGKIDDKGKITGAVEYGQLGKGTFTAEKK